MNDLINHLLRIINTQNPIRHRFCTKCVRIIHLRSMFKQKNSVFPFPFLSPLWVVVGGETPNLCRKVLIQVKTLWFWAILKKYFLKNLKSYLSIKYLVESFHEKLFEFVSQVF